MAERTRDKRRRGDRYTGILRDTHSNALLDERPTIAHGATRGDAKIQWRFFSSLILISLVIVLFLFFYSDAFYVRSISVGGLQYLTKEEIFAFADIANIHLFWIDPETVRANLLRSPGVADARVTLSWPPNMVQILVEERQPVLVWEQNGVASWIELSGRMMAQREERANLVRVIAEGDAFGGPLAANETIPQDVVAGALQLRELLPDVPAFRYHPNKGLGYKNENGWDIWFGTGINMPDKVLVYRAIAENLRARGIQPGEINVSNPTKPYYNVLWGR